MAVKKTVCLFSAVLLFSTLLYSVDALPDTAISLHGVGVTIDLEFPEEAHPNDNVTFTATLRANTGLTLNNLTLTIKVPIDSTWQEATGWYLFNRVLQANESRMEEMTFQLDTNANGTIQCFIYIDTTQSTDYLSTTFYTTEVRELTYSELLAKYAHLLAECDILNSTYNDLRLSYETLNASYNELSGNYSILDNSYNELLADYNKLQSDYNFLDNHYNELNSKFESVDSAHNSLVVDYNELQSDYIELNSTYYNMTGEYNALQSLYDTLNQTYTDSLQDSKDLEERVSRSESSQTIDQIIMFVFTVAVAVLVAFIIYLKRKKEQPYVVIRKETVSMKPDEKT